MKQVLAVFLLLVSMSVYSSELTTQKLTGKWLIVLMGDINPQEEGLGDDYWIFKNNTFQVETSGKALSPDPYRIEGSKIIYGTKPYEVAIDVVSISDQQMKVNASGIIQVLKKVQ